MTIGGAFNLNADRSSTTRDHQRWRPDGGARCQRAAEFRYLLLAGTAATLTARARFRIPIPGLIEISGGTLNVDVDIANVGPIKIDAWATLTVVIAAINGGTVTNDGMLSLNGVAPSDPSSGAPPATGGAILKDGTLNNAGVLHAETGAVLEKETVTNTGTIEVLALGALTLDLGTTVDNTGGTIVIDGTGTLTLDDATIERRHDQQLQPCLRRPSGSTSSPGGQSMLPVPARCQHTRILNNGQVTVAERHPRTR